MGFLARPFFVKLKNVIKKYDFLNGIIFMQTIDEGKNM